MRLRHHLIASTACVILAACAAPTQNVPKNDPAAIAREAQLQREIAQQAAANKGQLSSLSAAEASARVQRVGDRIAAAGKQVCGEMYPGQGCDFRIILDAEGPVNAYADGTTVHVSPAMVAFTAGDEELAMVLAHEYAHNTLSHPQATGQNSAVGNIAGALADRLAASRGYDTGDALAKAGAQYGQFRYSVDFEKEADYVGLYILARAGYDYAKTPEFWRRMSAYDPDSMYGGKSHPSNPDRFVGMNQAIAEIEAKKASGAPLLPERKPQKKSRWGF